tara:strand:- start:3506 stop:4561 length:1056 start_codon:yes stop_codon:yes gene_type:complete
MVFIAGGGVAFAQSHPVEQLFRSHIDEARAFILPENIEVSLDLLVGIRLLTDKEVDKLRRLAPTDVDAEHRYEKFLSQSKAGGEASRFELFYGKPGLWRLNSTPMTYSAVPYVDRASGSDGDWVLSSYQLQTSSNWRDVDEDAGYRPQDRVDLVIRSVGVMVAGIPWPVDMEYSVLSIEDKKGQSEILLSVGEGQYRLTVEVVGGGERLRVRRVENLQSDGANPGVGEFLEWEYSDILGVDVARTYVSMLPSGQMEKEYRLFHIGKLSKDLDVITRSPAADGVDEFRGAATYTSVIKHTAGDRVNLDPESRGITSLVDMDNGKDRGYPFVFVISVVFAAVFAVMVIRKQSI